MDAQSPTEFREDEDWTKLTDRSSRRRIQNRLSQRKRRRNAKLASEALRQQQEQQQQQQQEQPQQQPEEEPQPAQGSPQEMAMNQPLPHLQAELPQGQHPPDTPLGSAPPTVSDASSQYVPASCPEQAMSSTAEYCLGSSYPGMHDLPDVGELSDTADSIFTGVPDMPFRSSSAPEWDVLADGCRPGFPSKDMAIMSLEDVPPSPAYGTSPHMSSTAWRHVVKSRPYDPSMMPLGVQSRLPNRRSFQGAPESATLTSYPMQAMRDSSTDSTMSWDASIAAASIHSADSGDDQRSLASGKVFDLSPDPARSPPRSASIPSSSNSSLGSQKKAAAPMRREQTSSIQRKRTHRASSLGASSSEGSEVKPTGTTNGHTSLHLAVLSGHLAIVRLLLESGLDADSKNEEEQTAMHLATLEGNRAMVHLLLEQGASPNIGDKQGQTPLHLAASNGQVRLVELLLEYGSEADARDNAGYTCLHKAVMGGHEEVVRLMLTRGVDAKARVML